MLSLLFSFCPWTVAQQTANRHEFLEVKASHHVYSDLHGPWDLLIKDPGQSSIRVFGLGTKGDQPLAIPQGRLGELRAVIHRERFFELHESYGNLPVDGPERHIAIREGDRFKKVTIYSLRADSDVSGAKRTEIARALRVWIAIRNCFDAPGALDSRAEDRSFLEKLKRAA